MQEGQDRSGDQPPEHMGRWSPIPAGDQPDRPAGEELDAAGRLADQDDSAEPEGTWVIPAAGDQRSGTQPQDSAGPYPSGENLAGENLAGQNLPGQGRSGPDRPEDGFHEQSPPGPDQAGHGLAGLGFGEAGPPTP